MQKNLKSIASALPDSPACRSDAILLTYHYTEIVTLEAFIQSLLNNN